MEGKYSSASLKKNVSQKQVALEVMKICSISVKKLENAFNTFVLIHFKTFKYIKCLS